MNVNGKTCRGCGEPGADCVACKSHSNWYVACGCDGHGDHGGCSKACNRYGCVHPPGLTISGSLEESERYSGVAPPRHLVLKAVAEKRARILAKTDKKLAKLLKVERSLDSYEEARP